MEKVVVVKTKTGVWMDQPPEFDGFEAGIIRSQCGLTQAEMAEQLGMSERAYHTAERNGRRHHFQSVAIRSRLEFLMEQAKTAEDRERREGHR
jgi:hypothetical protein